MDCKPLQIMCFDDVTSHVSPPKKKTPLLAPFLAVFDVSRLGLMDSLLPENIRLSSGLPYEPGRWMSVVLV